MNQPKPCLAGCGMSERWPTRMFHDLGCPNAEAAKVEECGDGGAHDWSEESPVLHIVVCKRCGDSHVGKPTPAPAEKGEVDFEAADREARALSTEPGYAYQEQNVGRAYLALAAEVAQEKLFRRADIEQRDKFRAALDSKDAECVALAAEVERLRAALAGVLEAGATFSGGRWDAARAALSPEPGR